MHNNELHKEIKWQEIYGLISTALAAIKSLTDMQGLHTAWDALLISVSVQCSSHESLYLLYTSC